MLGQLVSFIGNNGPVKGIVVSEWVWKNDTYLLVKDDKGGYHGYRKDLVLGGS